MTSNPEPGGGPYDLLDAGDGRRLERFGVAVVDRPAPTATGPRRDWAAWRAATLRFEPGRGWIAAAGGEVRDPSSGDAEIGSWPIRIDGLDMELRPTASGGLGIYPEHRAHVAWLERQIDAQRSRGEPPHVLNLFAHTGLLTLAAARAGAAVAHVDASKGAVDWARRNAALSGLADRPVRWLVDDAAGFVAREARRGRRYQGLVLDPPSFGRAGRRQWKLGDELPGLLAACRRVVVDDAFILLTAHTTGLDGEELRAAFDAAFGASFRTGGESSVERVGLEAASGARLELGWAIRAGA